MAIQRWEHPAHKLEENNDHGPLVFYSDHLAAIAAKDAELKRERECRERLVSELENIVKADWRTWDAEYSNPQEFVAWAKNRANAALLAARELE